MAMIQNYFRLALRNLLKNPLFTFLNMTGLAVGLAAAAFIGLFILSEWQTDRFLPEHGRTFRVLRVSGLKDTPYEIGITAPNYAAALKSDFEGQIEETVRFMRGEAVVRLGENALFREKKMAWADPRFIPFFGLKMWAGDANNALEKPNGLVLTRKTARRYFGSEAAAMGKIVSLDNRTNAEVTGVLEDFPTQSHFDFDLLLSIKTPETSRDYWTDWWNNCLITYIRLAPGTSPNVVESRFGWFMDKYFAKDFATMGAPIGLRLQPLRGVYFAKDVRYDQIRHGSRSALQLFGFAALLLALVAGANYVNLSTAKATERSREIGVQKALGAGVGRIRRQILTESLLVAAVGIGLASAGVWAAMPFFESFFGGEFQLKIPAWGWVAAFVGATVGYGLLAGFYPAALMASFHPVEALRGKSGNGAGQSAVRRGLVVFQFGMSVVLICGTLAINRQLDFLNKKDLGYQREHILLVNTDNPEIYRKRPVFEQMLKNTPGVAAFTRMSGAPGGFYDALNFQVEGHDGIAKMRVTYVDNNFAETFGVQVLAGRDFSDDFASDSTQAVLLNASAVRQMGFQPADMIGKSIRETMFDSIPKQVVGVVADYHFSSLKDRIEPLVILQASWSGDYALRLDPSAQSVEKTVASIGETWRQLTPAFPFHYQFLDESLDRLYRSEARQGRVFGLFSSLAIFIACLGMFGLAAFAARQRTKEIGIRKVLGASVAGITSLLAKDFLKLVVVAIFIACPVAYYFMQQWLADFAYRIDIPWWVFAAAGLAAVIVALLTVGFQSVKAALANPVESLRSE